MPTRWDPEEGPSSRLAVVLPGVGYSPAHPLLEFARQALLQYGWTVQQVWWDPPRGLSPEEADAWVCDQARSALDADPQADRRLLVGKSLGTLAAPVAADLGLPAIWLTPLFDRTGSIDAVARNPRPQLLVGGFADPQWDGDRARTLGCDVADFLDATHFMNVPGDAVRSAQIQVEISRIVDAFLSGLAA